MNNDHTDYFAQFPITNLLLIIKKKRKKFKYLTVILWNEKLGFLII